MFGFVQWFFNNQFWIDVRPNYRHKFPNTFEFANFWNHMFEFPVWIEFRALFEIVGTCLDLFNEFLTISFESISAQIIITNSRKHVDSQISEITCSNSLLESSFDLSIDVWGECPKSNWAEDRWNYERYPPSTAIFAQALRARVPPKLSNGLPHPRFKMGDPAGFVEVEPNMFKMAARILEVKDIVASWKVILARHSTNAVYGPVARYVDKSFVVITEHWAAYEKDCAEMTSDTEEDFGTLFTLEDKFDAIMFIYLECKEAGVDAIVEHIERNVDPQIMMDESDTETEPVAPNTPQKITDDEMTSNTSSERSTP